MLGGCYNLELSEMVPTKHRYYEEPEESLNQDASSSGILTVGEDEIKTMLNVCSCLVQKRILITTWFKWEVAKC